MGSFILFIYVSAGGNYGGHSMLSAEFNSSTTCERAANIAKQRLSDRITDVQTICVEK